MISKQKLILLDKELAHLGIEKRDLIEKFIFASGKGGQRVNKVASCVYLKHLPSGIEIKSQKSRFREA